MLPGVETTAEPTSYRRLFAVGGFPRMAAGLLFGRTGDSTWSLVLVLFVLARWHSPALAGLAVLAGTGPGKLVSPLAGALLDRHGRSRLIVLDYTLAALVIGGVGGLDAAGALSPWMLIGLLVVLSVTQPLSETGMRSLFPLVVPRRLWDRANAVDSGTFVVATLLGPAAGGLVSGLAGVRVGVFSVAGLFAAAAVVTLGVRDPEHAPAEGEQLLRSALTGLRYVLRNPTLRGLAVVISLLNLAGGIVMVGVPVVVVQSRGGSATLAGILLACFGLSGLASGVITGRFDSEGRERRLLAWGNTVIAVGTLLLAIRGPVWLIAVALLIAGAGNGPCDIALFALRQRRTDPRMLGRAIAVSMALNGSGYPIGSAIAGAILAGGGTATVFIVGGVVTLLGVALIPPLIPRHGEALAPRR